MPRAGAGHGAWDAGFRHAAPWRAASRGSAARCRVSLLCRVLGLGPTPCRLLRSGSPFLAEGVLSRVSPPCTAPGTERAVDLVVERVNAAYLTSRPEAALLVPASRLPGAPGPDVGVILGDPSS